MAIPAGWEQSKDSNTPQIYRAVVTQANKVQGGVPSGVNVPITVDANGSTGSFTVYYESIGVNDLFGKTPIYTKSASGAISISDQGTYDYLLKQGTIQKIETAIKPKIVEINKTVATSEEKQALANSAFYKSSSNTAPAGKPTEPKGGSDGTDPPPTLTEEEQKTKAGSEGIFNGSLEIPGIPRRREFKTLVYHGDIEKNGQDYIKFDILDYGKKTLNPSDLNLSERDFSGNVLGTICLPIQPSISDQNRVDWNPDNNMDAFDMVKQSAALNIFDKGAEGLKEVLSTIETKVKEKAVSDAVGKALAAYFTQKSVGSQNNLLSRMSGAILNPNMELLFQGPTLRPFQFSFRMTPRGDKEATQVRSIIRAFKEASAVQQGIENLFLKAPYVFKIRYILGGSGGKDHPSINRIKICALQQMSVDYTPGQTFMTYNDSNATMTSYAMSLTFTELEPVYANDYMTKELENTSHIGY